MPNLFKQDLSISGDIDFGQDVRDLFGQIDIDWEEHLSHFTGDIIAHQLANLFTSTLKNVDEINTTFQQSLTEYLQEETKCLPCREELNDFFDDVDSMKLRVDRLQARTDS